MGVAYLQNKSWGTIITWKNSHIPYIDTSEKHLQPNADTRWFWCKLRHHLHLLHIPRMKPTRNHDRRAFWNHRKILEWCDKKTEVIHGSTKADTILLLPKNYGCGMRNSEDKIWAIASQLPTQYGITLNIINNDQTFLVIDKYTQIYHWNQTITPSNL